MDVRVFHQSELKCDTQKMDEVMVFGNVEMVVVAAATTTAVMMMMMVSCVHASQ